MAVDMFIKIGDIKGESKDRNHKDEIDVLSWSWGATNSGSAVGGGGLGAGKVSIQDLRFSKYVDKSSPDLMLACASGKHIPSATLALRRAGGDDGGGHEFLFIKMSDILVSGYQVSGAAGDDRPFEELALNFAKVEYTHVGENADGTQGTKKTVVWDVAKRRGG